MCDINKKNEKMKKRVKLKQMLVMGFTIITALSLAGCGEAPLALLDKVQTGLHNVKEASYTGAATSIDRYCARVPLSHRLTLRENINTRTIEGDITITCENDK